MNTEHLYIISESENGPVKLGRSNNAQARLQCLQTGNPRRLRIVATWDVPSSEVAQVERELNKELADFALIGEWFKFGERFALEYIPDFFLANGFEGRRSL